MLSTVLAPIERLLSLGRAQWNVVATGPNASNEEPREATSSELESKDINHEQIPPARREVPLLELLQASRRRGAPGDFEVVPRTKGVLVLEEGAETGNFVVMEEEEEWQHLGSDTRGRRSYAQVTKTSVA